MDTIAFCGCKCKDNTKWFDKDELS